MHSNVLLWSKELPGHMHGRGCGWCCECSSWVARAGTGAGAWQGPAKCRFEAPDGRVCIAGAGSGSPPPSPTKQSRAHPGSQPPPQRILSPVHPIRGAILSFPRNGSLPPYLRFAAMRTLAPAVTNPCFCRPPRPEMLSIAMRAHAFAVFRPGSTEQGGASYASIFASHSSSGERPEPACLSWEGAQGHAITRVGACMRHEGGREPQA